jgi:Zn finger protein HypA/HybF involved in hydrogenase expression
VLSVEFRALFDSTRAYLTAADISLESNYRVQWECSIHPGTFFSASPSARLRAEREDGSITGCDLCGREKRRISAQERGVERSGSLTQFYPLLAKEWVACIEDPRRTADNTSPGSNLQVKWQCQIHAHHNPWTTTVSSRTTGADCPDCFELRRPNIRRLSVLRQQGSITITHPQIAGEFVRCIHKSEFSANDLSHGSGELCEWMCEIHDKIFEASVHDRTSEIKGCPICGKLRGIKAVMDAALKRSGSLKEMYPEIAKQWVEPVYLEDSHLTPETISPHSNKYIYWKCDKHDQEHIWPSTIGNRTTGYGCPICKSSKGEIATASAMRILGVSFQSEMYVSNLFKKLGLRKPQISGRLSYDFAVFDADGLVAAFVEFHGIHHYEPINFGGSSQTERDVQRAFEEGKERDQIKTTLAKDLVIPQLVIPYWEMNNIEILLVEFFKQIKGVN